MMRSLQPYSHARPNSICATPPDAIGCLIERTIMKALWLIPISTATLLAAGPALKCDGLAAKSFGDEVKIHSAALVAAKGNLPEHCEVRGVIWPEAGFAIKLPTAWNDRFQILGNACTAGAIRFPPIPN